MVNKNVYKTKFLIVGLVKYCELAFSHNYETKTDGSKVSSRYFQSPMI